MPKRLLNTVKAVLLGAALLFLCACAERLSGAVKPQGVSLAGEEREVAFRKVFDHASSLRALQSLNDVQVQIDGKRQVFRYVIVLEGKSNAHFQILPPNAAYAVLAVKSNGREGVILDQSEKVAFTGEISRAAMKRYFRLPLLPREFVRLLTGVPLISRLNKADLEISKEQHSGRIELYSSSGGAYCLFEPNGWPKSCTLWDPATEETLAAAEYSAPKDCGGSSVPTKIHVRIQAFEMTMELEARQSKCNGSPSPALFTVAVPPGFAVRSL